jgi:phosphoglycolate phosphatase-like HAD superfamily hydrolase
LFWEYQEPYLCHNLGLRILILLINIGMSTWQIINQLFIIYDGIQQLLATLQKRLFSTGVVTSKTYKELQKDFVPFGLTNDLEFIVCADDTTLHKPHPDPLLKFLKISEQPAESSIYIGITIYGYECARDAGIDFGLALWGCKHPDLIPAKYNFEHSKDLLSLTCCR